MRNLYFILAFTLMSQCVLAEYIFFRGDVSTDWNDSRNWNPARVPLPADSVEISNQNHAELNNLTTTIKYLKISGRATLSIGEGAELVVSGAFKNALEMVLESNLENKGTLRVNNAGAHGLVLGDRSTITNTGSIVITNVSETGLQFISNATFMNEGAIEISTFGFQNTSFYGSNATFINNPSGTIEIIECPSTTRMHIDPSGIYIDNGLTTLRSSGCG